MMLSFLFTVQIVKVSHLVLFENQLKRSNAAKYTSQTPRLTQESLNYDLQLELN